MSGFSLSLSLPLKTKAQKNLNLKPMGPIDESKSFIKDFRPSTPNPIIERKVLKDGKVQSSLEHFNSDFRVSHPSHKNVDKGGSLSHQLTIRLTIRLPLRMETHQI